DAARAADRQLHISIDIGDRPGAAAACAQIDRACAASDGAAHRPAPIDIYVPRRAQDDQRRVLHPDAALAAHLDRGSVSRLTSVSGTAVAGTDLAAAETHAPTASQTAVDADLAAPTL